MMMHMENAYLSQYFYKNAPSQICMRYFIIYRATRKKIRISTKKCRYMKEESFARTPCIAVVCLNYNNKHYTVLQVILCVRASKCVLLCVFVCTVLCTNSLADIKYLWITEENNKNKPSQPTRARPLSTASLIELRIFLLKIKISESLFSPIMPNK